MKKRSPFPGPSQWPHRNWPGPVSTSNIQAILQDKRETHLRPTMPQDCLSGRFHGQGQGPSCVQQLQSLLRILQCNGFTKGGNSGHEVWDSFRNIGGYSHLPDHGGCFCLIVCVWVCHFAGIRGTVVLIARYGGVQVGIRTRKMSFRTAHVHPLKQSPVIKGLGLAQVQSQASAAVNSL